MKYEKEKEKLSVCSSLPVSDYIDNELSQNRGSSEESRLYENKWQLVLS